MHAGLLNHGAVPRFIGVRLGTVTGVDGIEIEVVLTFETAPSVLFDAVALPGGKAAVDALRMVGPALDFIKDQYRHTKPILALAEGVDLAESAGASSAQPSGERDPGIVIGKDGKAGKALLEFFGAIAKHRHHEREQDPPPV